MPSTYPRAVVLNKPEEIERYRNIILRQAIETHLKFNGRLKLTRTATPTRLRTLASQVTGNKYPRSRQGMESALADLRKLEGI